MVDIIERLATCSRQLLDAGAEIERLRAVKPLTTKEHDKDMLVAGLKHDLRKAADEIERLRAALDSITRWDSIYEALPDKLAQQIHRALTP